MKHSWLICIAVSALASPALGQQAQSKDPVATLTPAELAHGKRLFEGHCSRCHGMRGTGGDGPNLARPRLRHAPDDQALFGVIQNGIPGTGMPQTWQLSDGEIWKLVGYIRTLGRTARAEVSGNPEVGKSVYLGSGCDVCHIVGGRGGNLGPDLTDVGARRGPNHLRESLIDPGASLPEQLVEYYPAGYAQYLMVRLITKDGQEIRGVRLNEDTFTIQVRDGDDRIRSFEKSTLVGLEKKFGESLMPSYLDALSDSDLEDLVAYLISLRGES